MGTLTSKFYVRGKCGWCTLLFALAFECFELQRSVSPLLPMLKLSLSLR